MNTNAFLAAQQDYFEGAYKRFLSFGGPSVYFHEECLKSGKDGFLSDRHIEMIYATLTAWGMHRMGDPATTKTKLTDWVCFRDSILQNRECLLRFRKMKMLPSRESDYSDAVRALRSCYETFMLSVSSATVVVNSKALFHIFPDFIPPIDRHNTVRFFQQSPENWRDDDGKFRGVMLPADPGEQFELFHSLCVKIKQLADKVRLELLEHEYRVNGIAVPKAMDNAIVNYVTIIARQQ